MYSHQISENSVHKHTLKKGGRSPQVSSFQKQPQRQYLNQYQYTDRLRHRYQRRKHYLIWLPLWYWHLH